MFSWRWLTHAKSFSWILCESPILGKIFNTSVIPKVFSRWSLTYASRFFPRKRFQYFWRGHDGIRFSQTVFHTLSQVFSWVFMTGGRPLHAAAIGRRPQKQRDTKKRSTELRGPSKPTSINSTPHILWRCCNTDMTIPCSMPSSQYSHNLDRYWTKTHTTIRRNSFLRALLHALSQCFRDDGGSPFFSEQ